MRKPRLYKLHYSINRRKVGRIVSCASERGVIRSACVRLFDGDATRVEVYYHDALIAQIYRAADGRIVYTSKE